MHIGTVDMMKWTDLGVEIGIARALVVETHPMALEKAEGVRVEITRNASIGSIAGIGSRTEVGPGGLTVVLNQEEEARTHQGLTTIRPCPHLHL